MGLIQKTWGKHKSSIIVAALCLVVSTLFVLFLSFSTSPIYANYYGGDSAQFLTIGKNWGDGQVPYRDMFDHKGPIIFFVDMLGFLMGGKSMICVIQIICLTISLFFIYKILRLASSKKIYIFLGMFVTLVFLTLSYEDGNHVQEYCLPFVTASIYFLAKFLLNPKLKKHSWKIAILYGITCGVCLLTQATNAIPVGAGLIVIIFLLVKNKEFKNLWQNFLAGFAGLAVVCLPFVIYFACSNAWGDFIYASFIYNSEYASHVGTWLGRTNIDQLLSFSLTFFPYWCIAFTIFLAFLRDKYAYGSALIIAAIFETCLFFSTQAYPHYAIIILAQIALFINELHHLKMKSRVHKTLKIVLIVLLAAIVFKQSCGYIPYFLHKQHMVRKPNPIGYEKLVEPYLDDMKQTSALAVGGNELKDFYLKYSLPLHNKYFAIQGWHARFSPKTAEAIEEQFKTTDTKYIILDSNQWYRDIIQERYELIGQTTGFSLYRLK